MNQNGLKCLNCLKTKDEIEASIASKNLFSLDTYQDFVNSLFYQEEYEDVIEVVCDLSKLELESFTLLYYCVLSTIVLDDYYLGLSIIKKYKLINDEKIKTYFEEDGANYLNLLQENEEIQKAVIICLFLQKNKDVGSSSEEKMEMAFSYFELIGSLYEIGYANKTVLELTNIGHVLFKI